jgi:HPt (histidine-containing phosphotransfer) domain-containing protein
MPANTIDAATFAELQATTGAVFVVELVDAFLADAPPLLVAMRTAQAAGDAVAFRRAAHSLKSNGLTFGALEFSALAREMEETGLVALGDQVTNKLQQLESMYAAVASVLRELSHG